MPDAETRRNLDELRDHLNEKLAELHRRATRAGHVFSPSSYWSRPWLRFAVGAAIGFALGRVVTTTLRGDP